MNKSDYLHLRSNDQKALIYEFYKERFDGDKHKPFLSLVEVITYLPMWGNIVTILEKVINYYNQKFNIVNVLDKNGNLIYTL